MLLLQGRGGGVGLTDLDLEGVHLISTNFCSVGKTGTPPPLTHFNPMFYFYTLWKRQKTFGFLTFSEGIEMWHWTKMV